MQIHFSFVVTESNTFMQLEVNELNGTCSDALNIIKRQMVVEDKDRKLQSLKIATSEEHNTVPYSNFVFK